MRPWLQLARPGNALMTGAAVALAAYAAGGAAALAPAWRVAALALTGVLFAAGANALNDAGDAAIDRRAHPERPVPSGRVRAADARLVGLSLLALSMVPTAFAAPRALWVVAAALALELVYEARAKRAGLPGNVVVAALAAAPFVLGAVGVGAPRLEVLAFAALAAVATLGREVLKDLEDAPHDEGRATLARRAPAAAARTGAAALLAAVVLSPVPWLVPETVLGWGYLAAVAAADAAFVVAAVNAHDAARAQRVAKLAMLLALAALAVGRWHGEAG